MIIWVVRAWDNYYPSPDNALGYYMKKKDAEERYKEAVHSNKYDHCEYQPEEVL